jgi:hypothetical protein
MSGPDDLEERLRRHFRAMPDRLPDEWRNEVRGRIRHRPAGRAATLIGLVAAAIGVLSLGVAVFLATSSDLPTPGPSMSVAPSAPSVADASPSPTATLGEHRAGDILVVTGMGLREAIEAYPGDLLYIAEVAASTLGPVYRLEGPPRSGQEDAARVELPIDLVDRATAAGTVACPDAPLTLSKLDAIRPFERFVCLGQTTMTVPDVWVGTVTLGSPDLGPDPVGRLSRFQEPGSGAMPFSVAQGQVLPVGWSTVTGSFGNVDPTCGDWVGQLRCRERLVVDAVAGGQSPTRELAGRWDRMSDAPISGRSGFIALDLGDGTFIWGGDGADPTDGAIYRASDDRWTLIADPDQPGPRDTPAAVWTGQEILIWGGNDDREGLRYDPELDRWSAIPAAPIEAGYPVGAWTGSEFVVVTGAGQSAAYEPASMTWRRFEDAPLPRGYLVSVWTGRELVVLGLADGGRSQVIGAALDPASGAWRMLAGVPYDGLALGVHPVWIGTEMLFAGHAYDPVRDHWRLLSTEGCRVGDVSDGVWTGRWVINQSQAYDPATERCFMLPVAPSRPDFEGFGPIHEFHTPAWDDGKLVVWSGGTGLDGPGAPPDGIVFTPYEP